MKEHDTDSETKVFRIVLTGGPCSGKTTSMSYISDRLRSLGFNVVGVPEPIERERKFLVNGIDVFIPVRHEVVNIAQIYLKSEYENSRIRKRGQNGVFTYTHTIKKQLAPGKNIEKEKMISDKNFLYLLESRDVERHIIKKQEHVLFGKINIMS